MSYLVLARKYRPQTFEDVVEQAHVTQTLKNAILSERVAHAMLFSGPRGTGKTTIARILAKAMNCETGPTPTPCNQCQSCLEITKGNAADVFEIDGASNNGVDNIRDLRDNVQYMPSHSRFKIYIIDEVHMLSTAAFNALLKTLEEPPSHILFFFATTEPHKIPITILSRCQQHDLRRIDLAAVSFHLARLCEQEQVEIPTESLDLIAREAGGSMRDALSLLDQLMVCSQGAITHEQTTEILGVVDRKRLFDISDAVLSGDLVRVLKAIEELYDHGYAIKEFYTVMLDHFRNLLMVKMGRQAQELVDAPAHELQQMAGQVHTVSPVYLSQILDVFFKEESTIRFASQPKLALEMAFIRLFQIRPALPIDAVIQKLDDLSKGVVEAAPAQLSPPVQAAGALEVRERGPAATSRQTEKAASVQSPAVGGAPSSPPSAYGTPEQVKTEPVKAAPPEKTSVPPLQTETTGKVPSPQVPGEPIPGAQEQTTGKIQTPPQQPESAPLVQGEAGEEKASLPQQKEDALPEQASADAGTPVSTQQAKPGEPQARTEVETKPPAPQQPEAVVTETQTKAEPGPPAPQQSEAGVTQTQAKTEPEPPSPQQAETVAAKTQSKAETEFLQQSEAVESQPRSQIEPEPPSISQRSEAVAPLEPVKAEPAEAGAGQQDSSPPELRYEPGDPAEAAWGKLMELAARESSTLASSLSRCRLAALTENSLTIESQGSAFDVKQINRRKKVLQSICDSFFNRKMELTVGLAAGPSPKKVNRANRVQEARHAAANHPLVADAIEIFEGTLIDVKML